jgi:hypothetical protein
MRTSQIGLLGSTLFRLADNFKHRDDWGKPGLGRVPSERIPIRPLSTERKRFVHLYASLLKTRQCTAEIICFHTKVDETVTFP